MPVRRLTSILAALLVMVGLIAIPASSLARPAAPASHRQADDPSQDDQGAGSDDGSTDDSADLSDADLAALDGTDDSCVDSSDQSTDDSSGDTSSDDIGDDTGTDARDAPDDPSDDPSDDPGTDDGADDPGDDAGDDTNLGDDGSADDTGDDSSIDNCVADLTDEEVLGDLGGDDVTGLGKKGSFTETFDMPEGGTIDETLTGGAGSRAVIAKVKVLGTAHKKVAKAGKVTVRVKLNKQGRRAMRSARRALRLTLSTRISLKSGRTIKRTKALTVKPSKLKPGKGKHKKPAKHKRH